MFDPPVTGLNADDDETTSRVSSRYASKKLDHMRKKISKSSHFLLLFLLIEQL